MPQLTGKVALITGAGRGIGRGIALAFAGEGATLVSGRRTASHLERNRRSGGPRRSAVPAGDRAAGGRERRAASGSAVSPACRSEFGRLDLLVNNAGAFDGGPLDQLSMEAWDNVINTNLRGPFLCTRAALRMMKPQRAAGSSTSARSRPSACGRIPRPMPPASTACGG